MYSYKKDFFGKWKKEKGLSIAELARVLGIEARDKVKMWAGERELPKVKDGAKQEEDRGWLPLKHILRLCNHYPELKISDFIENAEEPEPVKKKGKKAENSDSMEAMKQVMEAQKQTIAALQQTVKAQEETIRSQREAMAAMSTKKDSRTNGTVDYVGM